MNARHVYRRDRRRWGKTFIAVAPLFAAGAVVCLAARGPWWLVALGILLLAVAGAKVWLGVQWWLRPGEPSRRWPPSQNGAA